MLYAQEERFTLYHGDNREVLKELADNSIDSIVTDPPYELGFMGKSWDASGIAFNVEVWQECLRVLWKGLRAWAHISSTGSFRATSTPRAPRARCRSA